MKKITNLTNGPIQLLVRSKNRRAGSPQLTCVILPGRGKKRNEVEISDEAYTSYIEDLRKKKLIQVQTVPGA